MSFPQIPITYNSLKYNLRLGLSNDAREYWWPCLPTIEQDSTISTYPPISETAENLVELMGQKDLNTTSLGYISNLLVTNHVAEALVLVTDVENIIATVIHRKDICYLVLSQLCSNEDKYISANFASVARRAFTFTVLLSHYMPKTKAALERINALDGIYLNTIYIGYFSSIFPPYICLAIFDSFLLEGIKIIHRYALALIRMHKREIKNGRFQTGQEFWNYVVTSAKSPETLSVLRHYAFDRDRSSLEKVRHPMKIAKSYLKSIDEQASHSNSTKINSNDIYRVDDQQQPSKTDDISSGESYENTVDAIEMAKDSTILNTASATKLRSFFVGAQSFLKFEILFSTAIDGYNMQTLYEKCYYRKPSIILIQGVSSSVIVGAFINSSISPPSTAVRGDGQSFCFIINPDGSGMAYQWRGLRADSQGEVLSPSEEAAKFQFAVCTNSYISVGGSAKTGSNAIRVDGDLQMCHCEASETFDNPPLIDDGKPFRIAHMEVYCGK